VSSIYEVQTNRRRRLLVITVLVESQAVRLGDVQNELDAVTARLEELAGRQQRPLNGQIPQLRKKNCFFRNCGILRLKYHFEIACKHMHIRWHQIALIKRFLVM
jgi:hypothetical protein